MKDDKPQPFWEKVKRKLSVLAAETAKPEPAESVMPQPKPPVAPPPAPGARPIPAPRKRTVESPSGDAMIRGGLTLKRGRYTTCELPPVDYQTGDLKDDQPPVPPQPPEPVDPLTMKGATEDELSPHRLALIEAFAAGRHPLAVMRDPQYMYRLITDERDYQTAALKACRREYLLARGEGGADVEDLELQLKRHGVIIQHLFKVLKALTGKEGSTGGTGFI
jgi:hypothetical protein